MIKNIIITFLIISGILLLIAALKSYKPFKTVFIYAFAGLWLFAIINLTAFFSGLYIPVNLTTVSVSAFFGPPGTAALLVLKYFLM